MGKAARKELKADVFSHLCNLGNRDIVAGTFNARPNTTFAVIYFAEAVPLEAVRDAVMDNIVDRIFRYRAVPYERKGVTVFEEVDELDLDYHFQHHDGFDDEDEWMAYLEAIPDNALDYDQPWWRYVTIDKIPDGRAAVLVVSDHGFADGASAVTAMMLACKPIGASANPVFKSSSAPSPADESKERRRSSRISSSSGSNRRSSRRQSQRVRKPRKLTPYEQVVAVARGAAMPLLEQALPGDQDNAMKQPWGKFPKKWRYAFSSKDGSIELDRFLEIKNKVPGATVNDVMLALTSLAVKAYLTQVGDDLIESGKDIRGSLAVNTRPKGVDYLSDEWFGNHVIVATTRYPLHEDRISTLQSIRDESRLRKEAIVDNFFRTMMFHVLSYFPREYVPFVMGQATCKPSLMISNVPFAIGQLEMFGQVIDDIRFCAITPLGMYTGACTYNGRVSFSVIMSADTKVDPEDILRIYEAEFEALYEEVMAADRKVLERDIAQEPSVELMAGVIVAVLSLLLLILL